MKSIAHFGAYTLGYCVDILGSSGCLHIVNIINKVRDEFGLPVLIHVTQFRSIMFYRHLRRIKSLELNSTHTRKRRLVLQKNTVLPGLF